MAESTVAAVQATLNRKQVELYELQVSPPTIVTVVNTVGLAAEYQTLGLILFCVVHSESFNFKELLRCRVIAISFMLIIFRQNQRSYSNFQLREGNNILKRFLNYIRGSELIEAGTGQNLVRETMIPRSSSRHKGQIHRQSCLKLYSV